MRATTLGLLFVIVLSSCRSSSEPPPAEAPPAEQPVEQPPTLDVERVPLFVRIPAGRFTMGSPASEAHRADDEQPHPVVITRDFELMAHEVTQRGWERLMGFNPSRFTECGEYCPVERINWFEAVAFANARSREASLDPCYELSGCHGEPGEEDYRCSEVRFVGLACAGFRLPTEAEWEYAARAGSSGPTYGDIEEVAWHEDNSRHRTHRVGLKQPNAFGLYDMLGNVWEWTWDWYAPYPDRPETDPTGPTTGEERVLRGGSWNFPLRNVRTAHRNRLSPGIRGRNGSTGLRLARTLTARTSRP